MERKVREPGSLISSEEAEAQAPEVTKETQIGPADASPHWGGFYKAIRDAVEALRSE
ncbi:hypothetical protein ACFPYJ_31345 [Paenibacillus solisilvae]|uniref:Uncharacterized protein n=1 Tax=Paenibacillus solisilvae TaxID=2486751 RepID=A0ABW0W7X2_9BACL